MKSLILTAVLSGLLLTAAPVAAQAQTAAAVERTVEPTTLNLSAFGETRVAPDQASISLGVQTKAATAAEAMQQNASEMNRVIAALRGAGLPDKAIQTSNLSLTAQYDYPQNQPPRLTGYQASNDVTVTVDELSRLGATLDAVVGAGANQINGVGFGLKNPQAAEDAARLAAVKALRAKADLYANATGYRLARLINLSEGGGYAPGPVRPMAMARMVAGAPSTTVSPGELSVRVDVSAVYEMAR